MIKYSIIVLLEEKFEDFHQFLGSLFHVFSRRHVPFEILILANGTGGFLKNQLTKLDGLNHRLRAFDFSTRTTEAACLRAGFKESSGEIIAVFGSYQQLTNDSLNKILDSLDNKTDIISPWRRNRIDPWFNQVQSRVFNAIVRKIAKSNLHDLSCTVHVFCREVLERTEIYGNMYRFLPIVAEQKGFITKEVECEHYQERGKTGFYSLSSYVTRLIDIFTLYFNTRFTKKPLRFFSSIGLGFSLLGLFTVVYVFIQRIFMGYPVGNRPILLLGIFFIVIGIQAASTGLLGEVIAFILGRQRKEFTIEKII